MYRQCYTGVCFVSFLFVNHVFFSGGKEGLGGGGGEEGAEVGRRSSCPFPYHGVAFALVPLPPNPPPPDLDCYLSDNPDDDVDCYIIDNNGM